MGDVSPDAVAGEEDSTKVGVVVEPRLGSLAGGVSCGPHKSLPRVVVRDGDRVLRAQSVVDRDNDDVGLRDEGNEVGGNEVGVDSGRMDKRIEIRVCNSPSNSNHFVFIQEMNCNDQPASVSLSRECGRPASNS